MKDEQGGERVPATCRFNVGQPDQEAQDMWQIQLFGELRAVAGERVLWRFPTRQTALLFAALALRPGRPHLRDALVDLLWPECDPRAGRHRLGQALSCLRETGDRP
jgi:DNA-binding SARP family transcriptional activator